MVLQRLHQTKRTHWYDRAFFHGKLIIKHSDNKNTDTNTLVIIFNGLMDLKKIHVQNTLPVFSTSLSLASFCHQI
jgi:hypothetical protein